VAGDCGPSVGRLDKTALSRATDGHRPTRNVATSPVADLPSGCGGSARFHATESGRLVDIRGSRRRENQKKKKKKKQEEEK